MTDLEIKLAAYVRDSVTLMQCNRELADAVEALNGRLRAAERRAARLREALEGVRHHVSHSEFCNFKWNLGACSCGHDEAVALAAAAEGES